MEAETIIKVENLVFDYVKSLQSKKDASDDQKAAASADNAAGEAAGSENGRETVRALDGISFDVKRGEFVAIIGRNGSGKTTLAKCLNALYVPTQGDVIVNGWNTKDEQHLWDIRQSAGMVFQNPDNQLVSSIVEDDVAFGPENLGLPPGIIRKRVDDALTAVGMSEFANRAPHMLSGGQKQRIAIAGVIAMKPDCIIFDESTAMLDPNGRREIMTIMKDLNKEGITVILITHFMEETVAADKILVMDSGKIVKEGTPIQIFADQEIAEEFKADLPCGVMLAMKLRKHGIDVPADMIREEQLADYITELYAGVQCDPSRDSEAATQCGPSIDPEAGVQGDPLCDTDETRGAEEV